MNDRSSWLEGAACPKRFARGDTRARRPRIRARIFFLSYAHTPRHDQSDSLDPDFWVGELHKELCRTSASHGLPQGARPVSWTGSYIRARVALRALAGARDLPCLRPAVLAALLRERALRQGVVRLHPPLAESRCREVTDACRRSFRRVWVPISQSSLPEAARSIQFDYGDVEPTPSTASTGSSSCPGSEMTTRRRLTISPGEIVDVAECHAGQRPGPIADYESLPSAFGADGQGMSGDQPPAHHHRRAAYGRAATRPGRLPTTGSPRGLEPVPAGSSRARATSRADLARHSRLPARRG